MSGFARIRARAADRYVTVNGLRIHYLDWGGEEKPPLVLLHGIGRLARSFEPIAPHFTGRYRVLAMDMRGHGHSGGICDYGGDEIFDIEAVHRLARADGHAMVVTCGTSMGGIATIRHGALIGGADAVVAVSPLGSWDWQGDAHPNARRSLQARIGTPAGRATMRAVGVRMPDRWTPPESPLEVVGKIAPTPLLIVHGADDRLFPPSHARRLYEAAAEPKRLLQAVA